MENLCNLIILLRIFFRVHLKLLIQQLIIQHFFRRFENGRLDGPKSKIVKLNKNNN